MLNMTKTFLCFLQKANLYFSKKKRHACNTNENYATVQEYSEIIPSGENYYSSRHTST